MPVVTPVPPPSAFAALRAGLDALVLGNDRFLGVEVEMISPAPHQVSLCGLRDLSSGNPLPKFARTSTISDHTGDIWRFFVRSSSIAIALVEVAQRSNGSLEFEFLAFREGWPIEQAVKAFYAAESIESARSATYNLHLTKVPGLCADFYWLQKADAATETEVLERSWLVSIFDAPAGFIAGRSYKPKDAFQSLEKEASRILNTAFARGLDRGGASESGGAPLETA